MTKIASSSSEPSTPEPVRASQSRLSELSKTLRQAPAQLREWAVDLCRRMDWARGLRAGTALSTPLLFADITGLTHLGWMGLGGLEAIVSDPGGPYRGRLGRLSLLSLGGALAIFLGTLAGNELRWALPVTLIFCFAWTYLTVLGQPFASAGVLILVIYICGIGDPEPSWKEALLRAGFLLAGGIWATILSLILWPLDPYRPARAAVADCYRGLAAFLESIGDMRSGNHSAHRWHRSNVLHKTRLRRLVEAARISVAGVRAENTAETAQGRHLLVLLETTDMVLQRAVALAEHAEASTQPLVPTPCSQAGLGFASLVELAKAAEWTANRLVRRRPLSDPTHEVPAIRAQLARFTVSLGECAPREDPDGQFLAHQVAEIASNLDTAVETAAALRSGAPPKARVKGASSAYVTHAIALSADLPTPWERLAANWNTRSLTLRHAARVALVCGFDVSLISERHVGHGYWLMLTSLIVLQPHVSGTFRRSLQRIGGTVGGGILAAFLAIVVHSQFITGVVLFPLALLSLALLPVSYAAFSFFLTPTFVLAYLRHTGDWQLAFLRIGNTIAGAAIAIAAMALLFPAYERERIANYLRASLVANRRYLEQLMQSWQSGNLDPRPLSLARRATGLAHNDMEESVERVLAESWTRKTSSESLLAFAAYLHRFSQSVTALVASGGTPQWKQSPEIQARLEAMDQRLLWLEENLPQTASALESEPPQTVPWPPLTTSATQGSEDSFPAQRQITRLERQTQVMRRHLEAIHEQPWLVSKLASKPVSK